MSTKKTAPAATPETQPVTDEPHREVAGTSLAETGLSEPETNPASAASGEDDLHLSQLDHDGDGRPGGSLSHAEQIERLQSDLAAAKERAAEAEEAHKVAVTRAEEAEAKLSDIATAADASPLSPAVQAIVNRTETGDLGGAILVYRQGMERPVAVADVAAALKTSEDDIRAAAEADETLVLSGDSIDIVRD